MQIKDFPVYLTMREKPVVTSQGYHLNGPSDVYTATYHQGDTLAQDTLEKPRVRFGEPHLTERAVGPFPVGSGEPGVALISRYRGPRFGRMFCLDRDGSPPTDLDLGAEPEGCAHVAPGGSEVILADIDELDSYDLKTDDYVKLCKLPPNESVRDLAINRDGARILVALGDKEDDLLPADKLAWFDRTTGKLESIPLKVKPEIEQMALSPDGHTLAAMTWWDLRLIDLSTGESRPLSSSGWEGSPVSAAFTPDGSRLLFACVGEDASDEHPYGRSHLYAVSPQGGPARLLLTDDHLQSAYPADPTVAQST